MSHSGTQLDYLKKKIDESISAVRQKKKSNKFKASVIKLSTIILGGLATILLGLDLAIDEKVFKNIAFVLAAIVTMLNALEPYFNYRSLWVEHEAAQAKFHRLNDRIVFMEIDAPNDQKLSHLTEELFEQYNQIWEDLSDRWIGYRRKE